MKLRSNEKHKDHCRDLMDKLMLDKGTGGDPEKSQCEVTQEADNGLQCFLGLDTEASLLQSRIL